MNLCGETLREINMFMEYFFSSELENTFYSEIEKENLVQFRWAEGKQTQNEIPLFITISREMARFSILQHNFPFSWSICMELSIFSETRLEIGQWMILFLQNSDVGHYTHKQKRYKYQRTRKSMRGSGRTKLNLQLFQCYMDECLVYGP